MSARNLPQEVATAGGRKARKYCLAIRRRVPTRGHALKTCCFFSAFGSPVPGEHTDV